MRAFLMLLAILATCVGLVVLALVIGAFADPTASLLTVVASMVWATYGPFLLLIALVASLIGVALRIAGRGRLGTAVLTVCTLSSIGAGYILARIALAAVEAGGTLHLGAMLSLGKMDEPPPDRVEVFGGADGTELRAAIYEPGPGAPAAPVIVYVHGGGFRTGSFTETAADLRWMSDRGWLVVSLEYRLFTPGQPTWDKAAPDVACGLAWVQRNAARLGGDPERLALFGDSAGGNLAINVGFAAAAGLAVRGCPMDGPAPRAVVVQYPAVDVATIYSDGFPIPGFEPKSLIEGFLGGSPDTFPERVEAVSSATYLTPLAPPTLIILPEKDSLVVPHGTMAFARKAKEAGVDLKLVRIPFANHVFNQIAAGSLGNQIGRTLRLGFVEAALQ